MAIECREYLEERMSGLVVRASQSGENLCALVRAGKGEGMLYPGSIEKTIEVYRALVELSALTGLHNELFPDDVRARELGEQVKPAVNQSGEEIVDLLNDYAKLRRKYTDLCELLNNLKTAEQKGNRE